jgi:hypothetical protein
VAQMVHEQALYSVVRSCTVRLDRRTAWLARCVVSAVRDTRPQAAPMTTMQTFGNRTSFNATSRARARSAPRRRR